MYALIITLTHPCVVKLEWNEVALYPDKHDARLYITMSGIYRLLLEQTYRWLVYAKTKRMQILQMEFISKL